jgi:hypothetical protein
MNNEINLIPVTAHGVGVNERAIWLASVPTTGNSLKFYDDPREFTVEKVLFKVTKPQSSEIHVYLTCGPAK